MDQNGRIIDAVKRIDAEMSSVRQILPGMIYQLPPPQSDKLDLLHVQPEQVVEKVAASGGREIAKELVLDNHSKVMYDPALIPADQIQSRTENEG